MAAAVAAAQAQGISSQAIEQFKASQGIANTQPAQPTRFSSIPQAAAPAAAEDAKTGAVGIPGFSASLRTFGAELFAGNRGRYITPSDLPVPADYVVGVGDTVEIRLFGKENRILSLPVQRNGTIVLPDIGDISVIGLTLEAMGKLVLERINKQKIGVEATVSMGQLRSIQIFLMGDVNSPGAVTTDALTTVSNALLFGGGIKLSGSMRRVEIRRQGKVISRIDLYDSLLKGSDRGELRLQAGDIVFVPAVGKRVGIDGEVLRPAVYELLNEKTAEDLVQLAGGFRPTAYPQSARLNRIGKDWQRSAQINPLATFTQRQQTLHDGDLFEIPAVVQTQQPTPGDFRFKTVTLNGNLVAQGTYEWRPNLTLGELIPRYEQLSLNAYRPLALIERIEPRTGTRQLLPVNLTDVILKQKAVPLERDDRVFVFDQQEIEFLSSAHVQQVLAGNLPTNLGQAATGVVINAQAARPDETALHLGAGKAFDVGPGQEEQNGAIAGQSNVCRGLVELSHIVANEGTTRFRSALFAGAYADDGKRLVKSIPCPAVFNQNPSFLPFLLENAITVRGEIKNPGVLPVPPDFSLDLALLARGGLTREADLEGIELNQVVPSSNGLANVTRRRLGQTSELAGIVAQPGDIVQIRKRASNQDTGLVRLSGEFAHPGAYEIRKGERLSELIARAGGLSPHAYPYGAVFLRPSIKEEKRQYYAKAVNDIQQNILFAMTRQTANTSPQGAGNATAAVELVKQLRVSDPIGRMVIEADPTVLQVRPELDIVLSPGDELHIPRRPSNILVMGEVLNPSAVQFESGKTPTDYLQAVGGLTRLADEARIFAILPNGSAQPLKLSSWNFKPTLLPPGSVIYVTREVLPSTNIDLLQIASGLVRDLAMSAAAFAVIGRN